MIKFVVPRKVKKIHRTYTPIDSDKKKIKRWFHFFSIKIIRLIFILFALIYGGFYLLKSSIFNHQYTIKRVLYDSWDIAWYDEPYLYKRISTRVKGENYYVVKLYKSRILNDITSIYPMVSDITIGYTSSNSRFAFLSQWNEFIIWTILQAVIIMIGTTNITFVSMISLTWSYRVFAVMRKVYSICRR